MATPSDAIGPPFICPFGQPVGNPATMTRCPRGFPGCACGDEMVRHLTGEVDDQTRRVVGWWEGNSDEF